MAQVEEIRCHSAQNVHIHPDGRACVHYERFQWLAKEIVDMGGESTLARVKEIEGMPPGALIALFNDARSKEYAETGKPLAALHKNKKLRRESPESFSNQFHKLKQRFQEIREIDYFQCAHAEDVRILFEKVEALESPKKKVLAGARRLRCQHLHRPRQNQRRQS